MKQSKSVEWKHEKGGKATSLHNFTSEVHFVNLSADPFTALSSDVMLHERVERKGDAC
jgi:hypothetical protein